MSDEYLLLEWGTLKAWRVENPEAQNKLAQYFDLGSSMSAMTQKDTDEQKKLLCEIVDLIDGDIQNDWSGKNYSKEEAKKYIMEYNA